MPNNFEMTELDRNKMSACVDNLIPIHTISIDKIFDLKVQKN